MNKFVPCYLIGGLIAISWAALPCLLYKNPQASLGDFFELLSHSVI